MAPTKGKVAKPEQRWGCRRSGTPGRRGKMSWFRRQCDMQWNTADQKAFP